MSIESLPLIVLLLLPGFLSWFIFCWGTVTHKISQLQYLFACLILSVLVFSISYPLTSLFMPLPGYMRILSNPVVLPLELGIAIYLTAIGLGFLLIRIYKSENIRRLLDWIGLDLYRHEHTWHRLFHESAYVTVYLKDGTIVAGAPTYFSQSGDKETAELYLTEIHYYQKEAWVKPDQPIEGLLINTALISRIEFRNPATVNREDISPAEGNHTSYILGRIDYLRMGILFYSFGLILIGIQDWISAYSIAGLVFIFLSLIFMLAGLYAKPRNAINSLIERQKNPIIKSAPKFFEWYILLILFAVGIAYSLGRLVQVNVPFRIGLYSIGFIWMFVSLIQLSLSLHQKRSDKDR